MSITKGTTTNTHADDSAAGTNYDYNDADGFKILLNGEGFTGPFTVKDALDRITYSSLAGDSYASETAYGYVRLATEADMDLITVNGDADNITDAVTVQKLQYWVNEVAPATSTTRGFVKLADPSDLDRDSTSPGVVTVGDLNTFLNSPDNAGSADKAGALQIATIAEANAGTSTTKAITPQALRQVVDSAVGQSNDVVASETVLGNVKLATSSEALSGNNNVNVLTPSTSKSAFDTWVNDWWSTNDNSEAVNAVLNSFVGQESNYPALLTGTPNASWVKKNGSILSRLTYPNLWKWVESHSEILVTEAEWQTLSEQSPTGAVTVYSSGDGSTTFRVPTVGEQSGFAKTIALDENIDTATASIGFLSNNKKHTHITDTSGDHNHSETPHTHSATFLGNPLPTHYHDVYAGNGGQYSSQAPSLYWTKDDHETRIGPAGGRTPTVPVSSGTPTGTVTVGPADASTEESGAHSHNVTESGEEQASPVGFYVQTFIFAGNADTSDVPITPQWLEQQNANTAAIADLNSRAGVPIGTIIAFDSTDPIPENWALCDGTNGTPDLRGRFIVGQDPNQDPSIPNSFISKGSYGGALSYTHNHNVTSSAHTLTWEEIPPHKHNTSWGWNNGSNFGYDNRRGNGQQGGNTCDYNNYNFLTSDYIIDPNSRDGYNYRTSAKPHSHNITLGNNEESIAPPYYVTVWIKRIS